MAFDLLGSLVSGSSTNLTASATHNLGAGSNRIILAFVTGEQGGNFSCTGVRYDTAGGNVAMTKVVEKAQTDGSIYVYASIWVLLEASIPAGTGNKTVTATVNGTAKGMSISVVSIQDANQETSNDTDIQGSAGATNLTASLDPTATALNFAVSSHGNDGDATTCTRTELADRSSGGAADRHVVSYYSATATATLKHTSGSSTRMAMVGVSYIEASGGRLMQLSTVIG